MDITVQVRKCFIENRTMKSNIALKAKENGQGIVLGDEETQLQFHYFWLLQKKMPLVL